MSELPDFLGGEQVADEAPIIEAPAPVADGPVRGPDGKFAAAATPEPVIAAPVAEPVAVEHQAPPLAALLDERDKRQAAERRAEGLEREARELREWRAQQEARRDATPPPSRETDPEGYEAHQRATVQAELYAQRLDSSLSMAEIRHGPDVAKAAFDWGVQRCDSDPYFNDKVKASRDPVGLVVSEWRREQTLSKISDPADVDAFLAWKASQAPGAAPAAPSPRPAAPRPSLASGPSASQIAEPEAMDGAATYTRMFG